MVLNQAYKCKVFERFLSKESVLDDFIRVVICVLGKTFDNSGKVGLIKSFFGIGEGESQLTVFENVDKGAHVPIAVFSVTVFGIYARI